jgi:hypothetical protein
MAVADRHGLPVAIHIESATPHEVKLIVPTLVEMVIPEAPQSLASENPQSMVREGPDFTPQQSCPFQRHDVFFSRELMEEALRRTLPK